jgi:transcription-repair coupling factor (superfamily II helicase)
LSTTIIESGLDIPNANTIIIDQAHRFGLSDLYQLRGRVGRYKHQAYAYLLIPRHARMLTDARKRIAAIKQYSALGSGFKIAMRDLEIRGAGNMLGAQQSGHITAVGFELYCQLLKQSVSRLRGEKVQPRIDVAMRLDFLALNVVEEGAQRGREEPRPTASIPASYVPDTRQRIELYRKLAQASDLEGVAQLRRELRDRFGPVPPATDRLLLVAEMRIVAQDKGITSIETKEDRLMMMRGGDYIQANGKFPRLTRKDPKARLREMRRVVEGV